MGSSRYLLGVALALLVGCGGARIGALESELGACKETKVALGAENAKLQEANAVFQAGADELAKIAQQSKQLHDDLQAGLLPLIDSGELQLSFRSGLVTISIASQRVFKDRKATVSSEGKKLLLEVAAMLKHFKEQRFMIAVHTDSRSVKKKRARARDNWDFTTQRAYKAYTIISAAGVASENLVVAGFGAAEPSGDNETEEGQATNRRLEIVAMPNTEEISPALAQAER